MYFPKSCETLESKFQEPFPWLYSSYKILTHDIYRKKEKNLGALAKVWQSYACNVESSMKRQKTTK